MQNILQIRTKSGIIYGNSCCEMSKEEMIMKEVFPSVVKQRLENDLAYKLRNADSSCAWKTDSLKEKGWALPESYRGLRALVCFWLGGGSVVALLAQALENQLEFLRDISIAIAIIAMIITFILPTGLLFGLGELRFQMKVRKVKRHNEKLRKEIDDLKASTEKLKAEAVKSAKKDYDNYLNEFEQEAQRMSINFADSDLAKEVIEWMTKGFCKTINSADRRGHVEKIVVPFRFDVYTNKITCNLGTYDFQIKRCRNLTGPIEQTALARAIANEIQINIKMEYPEDASGTETSINIVYEYANEFPVVTITYVAPNGNYKAVKDW